MLRRKVVVFLPVLVFLLALPGVLINYFFVFPLLALSTIVEVLGVLVGIGGIGSVHFLHTFIILSKFFLHGFGQRRLRVFVEVILHVSLSCKFFGLAMTRKSAVI